MCFKGSILPGVIYWETLYSSQYYQGQIDIFLTNISARSFIYIILNIIFCAAFSYRDDFPKFGKLNF